MTMNVALPQGRQLTTRVDGAVRPRTRFRWSRLINLLVFLLVVVAPAAAMLAYSLTTPSPIYASETSLAVRTRDGKSNVASGFSGIMANLGVGLASNNDVYVVRTYLQSHDVLALLEERLGYTRMVSAPKGDWWTRLPADADADAKLAHFRNMISIKLSTVEQIITIKARAFSPDDATRIARELAGAAEVFVNRLNERASQDFLAFAQDAVTKAEARVSETRLAINRWRNTNASIDPSRQFDMLQSIIGNQENELSKTRAEISEALGQRNVAAYEPRLRALRAKEEAIVRQIAQERQRLTGRDAAIADQLLAYERLGIERDLAEKSYASAVQSLEAARQEASQQQKYIVNVSAASRPESPSFPQPLFHTAVVALAAFLIWAILMLAAAVIRDYRTP